MNDSSDTGIFSGEDVGQRFHHGYLAVKPGEDGEHLQPHCGATNHE